MSIPLPSSIWARIVVELLIMAGLSIATILTIVALASRIALAAREPVHVPADLVEWVVTAVVVAVGSFLAAVVYTEVLRRRR
jgi:hypothetical protein